MRLLLQSLANKKDPGQISGRTESRHTLLPFVTLITTATCKDLSMFLPYSSPRNAKNKVTLLRSNFQPKTDSKKWGNEAQVEKEQMEQKANKKQEGRFEPKHVNYPSKCKSAIY